MSSRRMCPKLCLHPNLRLRYPLCSGAMLPAARELVLRQLQRQQDAGVRWQ